ncbi:MAG: TetR/AcrR family transcriptional regulator [Proteobacteria bacterium]|nr:TetR/AcrR family transcriptional regulator [Pseudomonadota bacterium]HQR03481.1 TetR/AcrR family transcriptional regulator [Rhodocyclaceae bacterium]
MARKTRSFDSVDTPAIPAPRKIPRQQRSQATVDFLIQTARQILYDKGADGLTTRFLSERSGVAVGSLYQYFPNRDAIIARLAEEEARRESEKLQGFFNLTRKLPLKEYIIRLVDRMVETEKRMLTYGGEFYRRYVRHYLVLLRVSSAHSGDVQDAAIIQKDTVRFLQIHAGEIREPDTELLAFLWARGISHYLSSIVTERPDLLASPRIKIVLARQYAALFDIPLTFTQEEWDRVLATPAPCETEAGKPAQ